MPDKLFCFVTMLQMRHPDKTREVSRSEAIAYTYAEAECYVIVLRSKGIPQSETVVITRIGRGASGIARTSPGIHEQSPKVGLTASCCQQSHHLGPGA